MNDDQFLSQFRSQPDPEFAKKLYDKISKEDDILLLQQEGHHNYHLNGHVPSARQMQARWDTRLTFVAAVLALFLFGTIIFAVNRPDQSSGVFLAPIHQEQATAESITSDNLDRLTQVARLGRGFIIGVNWSPTGDRLALAGSLGVWIYDPADLDTPLDFIETNGGYTQTIRFSPSGNTLVYTDMDGLHLWDVYESRSIDFDMTGVEQVASVAFASDDRLLATSDYQGVIRFWDLASGQMLNEASPFLTFTPVLNLAFSPDGTRLAFGGVNSPLVTLHDPTGTWVDFDVQPIIYPVKPVVEVGVGAVGFNATGDQIASRIGNEIVIWDVETQEIQTRIDVAPDGQQAGGAKGGGGLLTPFSPDGTQIATVDQSLRIWDIATGEEQVVVQASTFGMGNPGLLNAVSFDPNWERVAFIEGQTALHLIDVATGDIQVTQTNHDVQHLDAMAYSPDGLVLGATSIDLKIRVWAVDDVIDGLADDAVPGSVYDASADSQVRFGQSIMFDASRPQFYYHELDGLLQRWQVAMGESETLLALPVRAVGLRDGQVLAAVFSPDFDTFMILDAESGTVLHEIPFDKSNYVEHVVFSPDGRTVAVTVSAGLGAIPSPDRQVITMANTSIWLVDTVAGEVQAELEHHLDMVQRLSFSPDSTLLATGGNDGLTVIWDVATGEIETEISGNFAAPLALISPDNQMLVSSEYQDERHTLIFRDVETAEILKTFEINSPASAMNFNPDGTQLAVALSSGAITLWEIR